MVEADIIIQKIMCEKALIIGMAFVTINLFHYKLETPVLHPLAPSMAMLECGCWQKFWKPVLHPVTKFPSPSSKRAAG